MIYLNRLFITALNLFRHKEDRVSNGQGGEAGRTLLIIVNLNLLSFLTFFNALLIFTN